MNLKFHDERGNEIRIYDPNQFIALVKNQTIQSNTLVFDEEIGVWKPAGDTDAYHWALQVIKAQQNPYNTAPPANNAPVYGAPSNTPMSQGTLPPLNYAAYDPEPDRGWLVVVSVIVLLIACGLTLFAILRFSNSPFEAGVIFGQSIVWSFLSFIVALVIWLVPRKKSKPVGLAILAGCFLGASLVTTAKAWRDYQTITFTQQDIAAMLENLSNDQTLKPQDITEKRYGKTTPLVRICYEYFQAVKTDFSEMNQKFEELKIETLLHKETLQDAAHIDAGQKRIQSALEIIDKTETLQRQRTDEVVNKINSSDLPHPTKQGFITGFNSTKEQGLAQLSEFFSIERNIFAKADEMLNFMRQAQGRYGFQGEQLLFKSTKDAEAFNTLLREVQVFAAQETEWKTKAMRRGQEGLEKLKRGTNR